MGSTDYLIGVWQITYRLGLFAEWGTTECRKWFDDQVMSWANRCITGGGKGTFDTLEDEAEALNIS